MVINFTKDRLALVPYLTVEGSAIEWVAQIKILDAKFTANLTWNVHFDNIVSKASKHVLLVLVLACIPIVLY